MDAVGFFPVEMAPGAALPLPTDTIDVWRLALDVDDVAHARLQALLDDGERARAERLRIPSRRRRFEVGRGLLRGLLARYVGRAPAALAFDTGVHGKPRLRHASAPSFGVAHSEKMSNLSPCGARRERSATSRWPIWPRRIPSAAPSPSRARYRNRGLACWFCVLASILPSAAGIGRGHGEIGLDFGYSALDDNYGSDGGRAVVRGGYHFTDLFQLEVQGASSYTNCFGGLTLVVDEGGDGTAFHVGLGSRFFFGAHKRVAVRVEVSGTSENTFDDTAATAPGAFDATSTHLHAVVGFTWRLGRGR